MFYLLKLKVSGPIMRVYTLPVLLDSGWLLKEQVTCESLLGVKGLSILLFCKQVELSLYFNMFFCVILQFPS